MTGAVKLRRSVEPQGQRQVRAACDQGWA